MKRDGICGPWCTSFIEYFGRDGREEAEALLQRRSGDPNNPRILTAFNEKTSHWLAFLHVRASSRIATASSNWLLWPSRASIPLARTTKFMLTEEAHHMFVGESGVARVLQRTCEVMREHNLTDPSQVRAQGVIDLETLQRFVNFHYSVTLDLFGSEISSNAASFYTGGLKGRYGEAGIGDDHSLGSDVYTVQEVADGEIVNRQAAGPHGSQCALARRIHARDSGRRGSLEPDSGTIRYPVPL